MSDGTNLYIEAMPGCCGGVVVHNFGHTRCTGGDTSLFDLDEIEYELKRIIEQYHRRAFMLITLNDEQRAIYKKMLYKLGFRRVGVGLNVPHNNNNYVYLLILNKALEYNDG